MKLILPIHDFLRLARSGFVVAVLYTLVGAPLPAGAQSEEVATADESNSTAVLQGNLLAPRAFRAAAARVRPSLARIETFGGINPGELLGRGAPLRPGEGPTTGLVVSSDGLIITSTFNFLQQPPVITVVLSDRSRHVATLLGSDPARAICLLKIDNVEDLPVTEPAPLDEMRIGQWAVSVGVGFGDAEPAISVGTISGLHRIGGRAVQTDANLSPANYGGPLLDVEGRVVGICVPLTPTAGPGSTEGAKWYDSGIGFAVPLDGLDRAIEIMAAGEDVPRARLGIQIDDSPQQRGLAAIVSDVASDSPAEEAGIQNEDRIVSVDGVEVLGPVHLRQLIARFYVGDEVAFVIQRDDERQEISVTLDTTEGGS